MELNNIDTANPNPSSSSSVVSSGVKTRLDSCAKEDPFTNANSNTIVVTDAQPEPSQLRDISRYSLIFSTRAAVLMINFVCPRLVCMAVAISDNNSFLSLFLSFILFLFPPDFIYFFLTVIFYVSCLFSVAKNQNT